MNLLEPEYAKNAMSTIFKEVIVKDYSPYPDLYQRWGISVLGYSFKHSLTARISYMSINKVKFLLEIGGFEVMNSVWTHEDITETTYSYFVDIIENTMSSIDELKYDIHRFKEKKWIELEKKLNKIL